MKIYEVHYISEDDTTQHQFFPSKRKAETEYNRLAKIEKSQAHYDSEESEYKLVKCLFDIQEYEVQISKKGILEMLNIHFSETQ